MAWCTTNYFVHSQERGDPHSVVGLLFSFQRPSLTPGERDRVSFSGPGQLRSREDNRASSRGVASTSATRCRQEDMPTQVRHASGAAAGTRNIVTAPWVSSEGSSVSRVPLPDPSTAQTLWKSPRDSRGLSCVANGYRPRARPRNPCPLGPAFRPWGALSSALRPDVSTPLGRKNADQGIQADRSARSVRQDSAIALPGSAVAPPRRARADREIATSRSSASSTRSFTITNA